MDESKLAERQYDRLASEILQDQRIRVTIFTFSVTTTAAIVGLSFREAAEHIVAVVLAVYTVIVPSIMLIYHYTRSVNCKSEYLNLHHHERWMEHFDRLQEHVIPNDMTLPATHRFLHAMKAFSTERAFTIAYALLNVFVLAFALMRIEHRSAGIVSVFVGLFLLTYVVMALFRPVSKKRYRELWQQTLQNDGVSPSGNQGTA